MIDIIDIEEFSKENKEVPKGQHYRIKVDKQTFVVEKSTISGKEILELAGKTPYTKWILNQRLSGGAVVNIRYDQIVDLTSPGIEKFLTLPTDQTDGDELLRQFSLPEDDLEYLDTLGLPYETRIEQKNRWLILNGFEVPEGYNVESVSIAVRIDNGYPVAPLDMVYVHPPLIRKDSRPINALANQSINGMNYQRWSRHRTAQNPWRPGVDNISTHLALGYYWMEREFHKDRNRA